MPSIKSDPKFALFAETFFGILVHSFQMGRYLPQFLLFIFGQIGLDVLCITTEQVNSRGDHNVQVNDPRAATLSLALRRPSQLSRSGSAWYHVSGGRMVNEIN